MRSLIRMATKVGSRAIKLAKPKPKKKINTKEELAVEEVKKDNAGKEKEKQTIDDKAMQMLEMQRDDVLVNASGLEVTLRGHDYKVRLTKPAHGAEPQKLQTALTRNRELLQKSTADLYRFHCGNIEINKKYNQLLGDILKGVVKADNPKAKAAYAKMIESGKRNLDQWDENILRPGIQNALVARANIDLLIPLINMRGGVAEYQGQEALPINDHINALRDKTAKEASEDNIPPEEKPKTDEWTIQEFFTAAIIVIIIVFLLSQFI